MTDYSKQTALIDKTCSSAPVIPVLTIERVEDAVPMAKALVAGGLPVLEVTLRTENALAAIEAIAKNVPDAIVGAGTILNPADFDAAVAAGSQFIVSPGITLELLDHAVKQEVPLLPGIHSVSEMMEGIARGLTRFKFFPAELSGGVPALAAMAGPFGNIRFCPTGGVKVHTAANYLAQPNVMCVGGTWLTPKDLVDNGEWDKVEQLAREAVEATKAAA